MKEELLPLIADRCDRTKSVSLSVSTGILRLMALNGRCCVTTENTQLRFIVAIVVSGSVASTWHLAD